LLASPIQNYTQTSASQTLIQYIHGIDSTGMRRRDSDGDGNVEKLGDIVYSRPKYVGASNGHYNSFNGYTNFIRANRSQQNLLLAGANDGMLHAFDADTGQELWAYIPSSLLPYLEMLARPTYNNQYHRYYVNGQIKVEDVYLGGAWKTIAMFGLEGGGSQWIVLDITDRDSPQLMFELNDEASSGESWNEPVVVVAGGPSTSSSPSAYGWYMVVGTGEDKSTSGTNILVYNLASSPPSAQVISISSSDAAGTRTSSMAAVQSDLDLNVDRGYIGTENGDVFRINMPGAPGTWTVQKLYNGVSAQPITARPTAVLADNPIYSEGGSGSASKPYAVGVYFGTGRYDTTSDVTTVGTTSQNIIGIFDPTDIEGDDYSVVLTNITKSDLENQTLATFDTRFDDDGVYRVPVNKKGFYMNLATSINLSNNFIEPVGMVTHAPTNVRGVVIFSTFLPNQDACSVGGYGFIQALNFRTGGGNLVDSFADPNASFYNGGVPDINEDGSRNSTDLDAGFASGSLGAVLDARVESVDLTSRTPYVHDGELQKNDILLDSSNGSAKPVVSSLGVNGVPGPPAVLFQDGQIVIQSAYIVTVNQETGSEDDDLATVDICYSATGSLEDRETLTVSEADLSDYLAMGAETGACPESEDEDEDDRITICHIPPGNPANAHTITVSQNAWPAHQAHGDTEGSCGGDDDDDGDDGGAGGSTEELSTPDQVPINIYNLPPSVLGYHEVTGE
ncbi:MAG: PilC/PilY family type IV pilus protein, partial [Bdellovibrionota bacterium]